MNNEEKILQMLEQLQQGQAELRTEMRAGQAEMRAGQAEMRADIDKLNQTVARIEVDHGKKLSALYDAHLDTVRNAATIRGLDAKVDEHDHRIFALEQKVSNG